MLHHVCCWLYHRANSCPGKNSPWETKLTRAVRVRAAAFPYLFFPRGKSANYYPPPQPSCDTVENVFRLIQDYVFKWYHLTVKNIPEFEN